MTIIFGHKLFGTDKIRKIKWINSNNKIPELMRPNSKMPYYKHTCPFSECGMTNSIENER